jgi:hypothetical protein
MTVKEKNSELQKPFLFKVLRIVSLMPILLWPLIFYGTVFFFDDPNSNVILVYLAFIAVNSYPLYLIGNLILSNRLYEKNYKISIVLLIWPIGLFGFLFIYIFIN